MTAIERVEQAARAAGIEVRPSVMRQELMLTAPTARMWVGYDVAGRLTGAATLAGVMPVAGLEVRVLAWVERNAVVAHADRLGDLFADVKDSTRAADALDQGGESGVAQLKAFGVRGVDVAELADRIRTASAGVESRVEAAQERRSAYVDPGPSAWVSVDRLGGDTFEIGLRDYHVVTLTRDQAVELVIRLGEALFR